MATLCSKAERTFRFGNFPANRYISHKPVPRNRPADRVNSHGGPAHFTRPKNFLSLGSKFSDWTPFLVTTPVNGHVTALPPPFPPVGCGGGYFGGGVHLEIWITSKSDNYMWDLQSQVIKPGGDIRRVDISIYM